MTVEKDTSLMRQHGLSYEFPIAFQRNYLTPVEQFFICNSGSSPVVDSSSYSLNISGNGVGKSLCLSYQDLLAMPQHTVPAIIECAGNHRSLFQDVDGKRIETPPGTEELLWGTGAVGMAEWAGVPLAHVLREACVSDDAVHVCATGLETDSTEGVVRKPLPLSKAMDPDTLLALQMNSEPLTTDHGFPVRLLVPGWIGAYSVKWVGQLDVSLEEIQVRRNTESYVMMGDQWPAAEYSPAKGKPLTTLNIKSSLALPWEAKLKPGKHRLHGFARSPGQKIERVEWSDDGGQHWQTAQLSSANEKYGWVRFEFNWQAHVGDHHILTRATDTAGETQPASVSFNTAGYLYNAVYPHPVVVA